MYGDHSTFKASQNFSHASHPADFRVGSRKKRGNLYIPAAVDGLHVVRDEGPRTDFAILYALSADTNSSAFCFISNRPLNK